MKLRVVAGAVGVLAAAAALFATCGPGGDAPPSELASPPAKSIPAAPASNGRGRRLRADAESSPDARDGPDARVGAYDRQIESLRVESLRDALDPRLEGFYGLERQLDIRGGRPENHFFSPATTLTVRLLQAGRPLAGVVVGGPGGVRSGDDGIARVVVARGFRGFVIAEAPDGVQLALVPPPDAAETFDFGDIRVEPAGTITGRVVDEDGRPSEGAVAELRSGDLACRTVAICVVDAEGRFSLGRVGPYRYEVVARSGDRCARVPAVWAGADLRLVMKKTFQLTLRIVDDATGARQLGDVCSVTCELRRPGAPRDAALHELFAPDGHTDERVPLCDPGTYEIDVRASDGRRALTGHVAAIDLAPGRENVVEVRLVEQK